MPNIGIFGQYSPNTWGKPTNVEGTISLVIYDTVRPPTLSSEAKDVIRPPIKLTTRESLRVGQVMQKASEKYSGVRINGDIVEGVDKVTGKLVTIAKIRDLVRIDLNSR